jgi:hypothetical protein
MARAPISVQSAPSFSIWRAASATRMPSRENSRASDALRPSPAPTIRAILYFGVSISVSLSFDVYHQMRQVVDGSKVTTG